MRERFKIPQKNLDLINGEVSMSELEPPLGKIFMLDKMKFKKLNGNLISISELAEFLTK